MEFINFIKLLKRHRYTIILVPVIAIIITYFLTKNQPNVYTSRAVIATGIVDQTQNVFNEGADAQESKISQEFSNLIEMLRSKKVLDQVSYTLMVHDLTNADPYKQPSSLLKQLNQSAKLHAVQTFTDLYSRRDALSLFDPDQNGLNRLLTSMKYDDQSLLDYLSIYRVQNSDYIEIQFDSETAKLSADVVNLICKEFIDYYTQLRKDNQRKAVDFWAALLKAKEDTLNQKMAELKQYKIDNHVLNLNEKAKSIYGQITDFETRREDVERSVESTQAAINEIDAQFNPADRKYRESARVDESRDILTVRDQLQAVNNTYVQSNFNPKYKKQIDSLSAVLSSHVQKLNDRYVLNPLNAKQDLVQQKLTLQIQNDLAKNSAGAINRELARLTKEFDSLVPHEGTIQAYESAIAVASQEYLEILAKYNQTNLVSKVSVQLRLAERAEPGRAAPSKKMLLVILSGIISFVFCIIVFFLLFFFDNSIKSARDLANATKLPVLGNLSLLTNKSIDLRQIWSAGKQTDELRQFKNLIQSIRYEVDNELAGQKLLLMNSIYKGEGKTFIAINLAYAYSAINKKVLLVDGNFTNSGISDFATSKFYLEDFLQGGIDNSFLSGNAGITVLCNKGGDISLLELASEQHIAEKFDLLKRTFDIVIIESSALETLNKAKEWINFSDKILTVFEAGQSIDEETKQQIEYLKTANGKFVGWVLNLEQPEHHAA